MFSFRRSRNDGGGFGSQQTDALFEPLAEAVLSKAPDRSGSNEKARSAKPDASVPASVPGADRHLRALGLTSHATWAQVDEAHRRLVADLTPGPGASHQNVELAEQFLAEVNQAYSALRAIAVA